MLLQVAEDLSSDVSSTTPASEPRLSPRCPECGQRRLTQTQAEPLLTSTFEEVAVDILYGGIDGRPSGDASRSDVRVILGIYILKSFPWDSRMEFWKIPNKMKT